MVGLSGINLNSILLTIELFNLGLLTQYSFLPKTAALLKCSNLS